MTLRRTLKIEAKQALENWAIRLNSEIAYLPEEKMDEALDLALDSSGVMKDILNRLMQYMDDEDDYDDPALNELRDDLSTCLKEIRAFQEDYQEIVRAQYAHIGDETDDEPEPTEDMFESYPADEDAQEDDDDDEYFFDD